MEERPGDTAEAVKLLWRGSVGELQPPSVCTVFVAIAPFAALSWAWRLCGRLLGSQGSGGRVRLCTPCGASGDAAGAVQEAPAALERVGTTPARRVHAEPNSHGGVLGQGGVWRRGGRQLRGPRVAAPSDHLSTLRPTRRPMLAWTSAALPWFARGPLTKTGKLQDTHFWGFLTVMTHLSRHSVVAPILTAPLLTDTCRSTVGPGTREDIVVTVYSFLMVYIAPALASIKLLQYRSTCSGGGGLLFLERPQHLLQW